MKKHQPNKECGLDDPERADALLYGGKPDTHRRGFLKGTGLAAIGGAIGAAIPFHRNMPDGFIPAALAQKIKQVLKGKVISRYMGGPVELATAHNGAIVNAKLIEAYPKNWYTEKSV